MNNEKTVNSTIKDSTVKATPKKKKMKETSEIPKTWKTVDYNNDNCNFSLC